MLLTDHLTPDELRTHDTVSSLLRDPETRGEVLDFCQDDLRTLPGIWPRNNPRAAYSVDPAPRAPHHGPA